MLFIKSVMIGLSIAAPVGPIGLLCIQRSLSRGFRSGFSTGIGAACADAVYGLLGAIGIVGIATALPLLSVVLKIGGGAFLIWLASRIAREAPTAQTALPATARTTLLRDFLTTFGLTLSNPMTILSFIAVFAALGPVSAGQTAQEGAGWLTLLPMVGGVFAGSAAWWLCLSGATASLRRKMPDSLMHGIARLSAFAIAVFGGFQVVVGLRNFI
ncbi:LysE family translocator [Paraburkholderia dinghuensis]|uniref:Lysine transporter LysE n=1 Tax=Paraburkholderia dinghuensis TaxID=2305225 RepID=A0A3N6MT30_9BURK|nr:LysE family transporter [Paraburkholderia dinghuensis]RQH07134.1 lysine transporter LysE [Paraburkholderia dinghuensis]